MGLVYFYVGKSSEFILKELTDKTKPEVKKSFLLFSKNNSKSYI